VLVDTASPVIGVAAWDGDDCRGAWTTRLSAGAEGWLAPTLAEALTHLDGLDAVAVVTGPGTFTGLRVGLAHALGLALARGVPVIPVPTLPLRAAALPGRAYVLALLDARKGRLYAQLFDTRAAVPVPRGPPGDVPPGDLEAMLAASGVPSERFPEVSAVGEGVGVVTRALAALGVQMPVIAEEAALRAAGALLRTIPPRDAATVVPEYLREPDAQPPRGLPVMLP